jgi:hypothetical protein
MSTGDAGLRANALFLLSLCPRTTSVQELSQPSLRPGLWFTPLKLCKLVL